MNEPTPTPDKATGHHATAVCHLRAGGRDYVGSARVDISRGRMHTAALAAIDIAAGEASAKCVDDEIEQTSAGVAGADMSASVTLRTTAGDFEEFVLTCTAPVVEPLRALRALCGGVASDARHWAVANLADRDDTAHLLQSPANAARLRESLADARRPRATGS